METYAVCYENASVGTMTAEREGDCLRVALRCRGCGQGIYRAFLLCRRGEIPLGVLEPPSEPVVVQAARDRIIRAASTSAIIFFIAISFLF